MFDKLLPGPQQKCDKKKKSPTLRVFLLEIRANFKISSQIRYWFLTKP